MYIIYAGRRSDRFCVRSLAALTHTLGVREDLCRFSCRSVLKSRSFMDIGSFVLPARSSGDESAHVGYLAHLWTPGHGFQHET